MPESSVRPLSAQRANEARLLALMLRTSRLTWLFAADGTDKSALLRQGVLPLLQRRRQDRVAAVELRNPLPSATRERRAAASGRSRETVIYFERWDETPLATLKTALIQSLPAESRAGFTPYSRLSKLIGDIEGGAGLSLFFVVNNFERFFGKSISGAERSAFADEWSEAVCSTRLGASFLMSLDERHRPGLDLFSRRVPGLDHNALRLLPATTALTRQPAPAEMPEKRQPAVGTPALRGPRRAARLRPPPIKVDEVYAFIESTLAKTAVQPTAAEWPEGPLVIDTPGLPELSLTFAPENYLSPATRDALAPGAAFEPESGAARSGQDATANAQTSAKGRRLLGVFKRARNGKA